MHWQQYPRSVSQISTFHYFLFFLTGKSSSTSIGFPIIISPLHAKKPSVLTDRGRELRGTTSGSSASHDADLTASNNASRCFGRPRPPLLLLQAGHSGRYFSGFSHCLAPTGSSLAEKETLTSSFQRVYQIILTRISQFVKLFIGSYRC